MKHPHYTDLIFDLYGTLVDIHTDENDTVWERPPFILAITERIIPPTHSGRPLSKS